MQKIVVSVLGVDRPGIVAGISLILSEHGCNIEDVSQTILQTEFACIYVISTPDDVSREQLHSALQEGLRPLGLHVVVKALEPAPSGAPSRPGEPFVVTTIGPDRIGLVAGIAELMARFGVNITNLKAVFRGGSHPYNNIMIYEVDIPAETDQQAFRDALHKKAEELGLDLSLQHRNIFEAINRI